MAIPQDFIDNLVHDVDIVSVIDARVPLKKAGREYSACCPFHDEKTPSFTVSQTKGFYHCFGCGAHGTAIRFLMEYERLGFREAVEEIAHSLGREVPSDGAPVKPPPDPGLLDLMQQAAAWYQSQLYSHPRASACRGYLKQRGLNRQTAETFGLGFAPPGWESLVRGLGAGKSPTPAATDALSAKLVENGMLIEKDDGRRYDRFRERLMFPIRDRRGRVIGFGGRALGDAKPKYLNSPETELFHKGRELYGLHELIESRQKPRQMVVVEGYMDVIALAQYGIGYAVATLGTATTEDHLRQLFRVAPGLVFCFDGDRAGRQAAWRALNTTLPFMEEGRQVGFLMLPDGEDPDTLVRKGGSEAFEQRIAQARPLSEFLFDGLRQDSDLTSVEGRARLAEAAKPLLAALPDGVYRQMMADKLERMVGMQHGELSSQLQAMPTTDAAPRRRQPRAPARSLRRPRGAGVMSLAERAIVMLQQQPGLVAGLDDETVADLARGDDGMLELLVQVLEIVRDRPNINPARLPEELPDADLGERLAGLATQQLEQPEQLREREFLAAIAGLRSAVVTQRIEALQRVGVGHLEPGERELLRELYERKRQLQQDRRGSPGD